VTGPGGPGLHRVTWNFQGKQPPPRTLSPSQKRDSTLLVRRIAVVLDSLGKTGMSPEILTPLKEGLLAGDIQGLAQRLGLGGGGGGGGGGGAAAGAVTGRFAERPGETTPRVPGRAQAQPAGEQQESSEEPGGQFEPGFAQQLGQLLRLPGQPAGGGGGGAGGAFGFVAQAFGRPGGGAPVVASGDYLVSLTVGDRTLTRVLRVERLTGAGGAATFAFE